MTAPGVLVIGAASEAREALGELLAALPTTFPLPIVAVTHRADGDGFAEELAARIGREVREPDDKDAVHAGGVLLAPPGYHVLLDRGVVVLSREPALHGERPAIDPLFESASEAYRGDALGILLSAGGPDGVVGLAALTAAGARVATGRVGDGADRGGPRAVWSELGIAQLAEWAVTESRRERHPERR